VSRKIAVASLIWGGSILASRLIGLVREAVIGRMLGVSGEADAYWAAFVVPDFLNYVLAGGALTIVFLPLFGAYLARGEEERGWESFRALSVLLALLLGVATTVLWLRLPSLAGLVAPGFDAAGRARVVELTRIVLFAQIFHVLGGLASAALLAKDRHLVPALAPLVYNAAIVAGGLLGGRAYGAEGFAWGVLVGSALGPFLLPWIACARYGRLLSGRVDLRHPDVRTYLVRSLPVMLGFSIVVVDDWFLRRQGSLLGSGAVSALAYAKTLMRVPVGVVGLAAGVAAFPTLARLAGEGKREALRDTLLATLRPLVLVSAAATVVLLVAAPEIVTLVYGRRRLDPAEIELIARALALVSLGLVAWTAHPLLARGFYALGNTWLPAVTGTAVALFAYPVYSALRARTGVEGLAVASSLAVLVYVGLLGALLLRLLPPLARSARVELGWFAGKAALALLSGWGAGTALRATIGELPAGTAGTLARLVLLGGAGVVAFALAAFLLGLREVRSLLRVRSPSSTSPS
jgi:putative peptidoglycan lipid II flippase